jgi:hypothetical protein
MIGIWTNQTAVEMNPRVEVGTRKITGISGDLVMEF